MMTTDRARKQAIRARMEQTGEPYAVAARHLDAEQDLASAPAETAQAVLDEDIPQKERGITALPEDATPAQRARAEALWRPQADPAQPCRCSGTSCHHGEPCEEAEDDEDTCSGRLVHVDRYPGDFFSRTVWEDAYVCSETETGCTSVVELPELPWGEPREGGGIVIYDDVRHPNFPETHPGYDNAAETPSGDGSCRGCGGYAFAGLVCEGCRAEGWSDVGGYVEEPEFDVDADEDQDDDEPGDVPEPELVFDPAHPHYGTASDQGPRPAQCDATAFHTLNVGYGWAAAVIDGYGPHPDVPAAAHSAAEVAARTGAREGAHNGLLAAGRTLTEITANDWAGSGCVGALVDANAFGRLTATWTGDVRVHTIHQSAHGRTWLRLRTRDHTEGQRLRDAAAAGQMITEDPDEHDHVVLTTLGRLPEEPNSLGSVTLPACAGVLITTDGLHDAIGPEQMALTLAAIDDPNECAAALVEDARRADALRDQDQAVNDNATAVLLRFPQVQDPDAAWRERLQRLRRSGPDDLDALKWRGFHERQSRDYLHRCGYGTGEEAADAATIEAVNEALRTNPAQVTRAAQNAARHLTAAVDRRRRAAERAAEESVATES